MPSSYLIFCRMKKRTIDDLKSATAAEPLPDFRTEGPSSGKGKEKMSDKLEALKREQATVLEVPPVEKEPPAEEVPPFFAELAQKLLNYHNWVNEEVFPRFVKAGHTDAIAEHQQKFGRQLLLASKSPAALGSMAATIGAGLNAPQHGKPRYFYHVIRQIKNGIIANKPMKELEALVPKDSELFTGQEAYFNEEFRDVTLKSLRYMEYFAKSMHEYSKQFAK